MNSSLGDEIATLAANLEAAEYQLITKIGQFDASGEWAGLGALSCAHWLNWRIGLALGPAREKVRVARVLPKLSKISKAFEEGRLSYSKVRAMVRVATPENEDLLLQMAMSTTASVLETLCRKFRSVLDRERESETPEEAEAKRSATYHHLKDGRMRFTIDLPADEGARFLAAIDAACVCEEKTDAASEEKTEDVSAETPPAATPIAATAPAGRRRRTRGDGVMIVAESFLATGPRERAGGPPYEVQLHVTPAELKGGIEGAFIANAGIASVSAETARRLCCDAALVVVAEDEQGHVLDIGRRSRILPVALRRALRIRDGHRCQFPACTNTMWLESHHVEHWIDGGETKLSNLLTLCRRHHHYAHEHGYVVAFDENGEPSFTPPHSKVPIPKSGIPPACPSDAVESLAEGHADRGLDLDELTLIPPDYDGEPADHDWVVQVMYQQTFRSTAIQPSS
jgi:hypothetical protein